MTKPLSAVATKWTFSLMSQPQYSRRLLRCVLYCQLLLVTPILDKLYCIFLYCAITEFRRVPSATYSIDKVITRRSLVLMPNKAFHDSTVAMCHPSYFLASISNGVSSGWTAFGKISKLCKSTFMFGNVLEKYSERKEVCVERVQGTSC